MRCAKRIVGLENAVSVRKRSFPRENTRESREKSKSSGALPTKEAKVVIVHVKSEGTKHKARDFYLDNGESAQDPGQWTLRRSGRERHQLDWLATDEIQKMRGEE